MQALLSERLECLFRVHRHADYVTDIFQPFGLPSLFVGEKVLRPDKSYASKYLTVWLAHAFHLYRGKRILEIGCGTGVQSITMAIGGARYVVATDISPWAVRSCIENMYRLRLQRWMAARQGDLFNPIDQGERFDVVLFNHPFFSGRPNPATPFEESLLDHRELAGVFLSEVWRFLEPGGLVMMPFSSVCGLNNDPRRYAVQLSLSYNPLFEFDDPDGKHWLFSFHPRADWRIALPWARTQSALQSPSCGRPSSPVIFRPDS